MVVTSHALRGRALATLASCALALSLVPAGGVALAAEAPSEQAETPTASSTTDGCALESAWYYNGNNNGVQISGRVTDNISANSYSRWAAPVRSYLVEEDGTLMRVEAASDGVLVERYTKHNGLLSSQVLPMELPIFGGFFAGKQYNFLVFGQQNPSQADTAEVVRVVKYDKDWKRLDATSIGNINTTVPFDAGSLRMDEAAGRLYIYTCHEMYRSADGYNHQSNMTFVLDQASMEIVDGYAGIMNIAQAGYVSHSFNQYVRTDGGYVYRVDHGDAHPRAVSITRASLADSVTNVSYTLPFQISGATGDNTTGVTVGGFEVSSTSCLVAGSSIDQGAFGTSLQPNIFVTTTDKELSGTTVTWLTSYGEGGPNMGTPHMVKVADDLMLVMWEEQSTSNLNDFKTCMILVDGTGNTASPMFTQNVRLSDCKPVMCADGLVKWYVTDGSKCMLVQVNPYNLGASVATGRPSPVGSLSTFRDLNVDAWYMMPATAEGASVVEYAYDNGLITGYSGDLAGLFGPDDSLTRAQVATILCRIGAPADYSGEGATGFTDVPEGAWYSGAIKWCRDNGIISGFGDGTFGPGQNITRQDLAVMLMRFCTEFAGATLAQADITGYPDYAAISDYARGSLAFCKAYGIMSGNAATGEAQPHANATRAQMAKMITVVTSEVLGK